MKKLALLIVLIFSIGMNAQTKKKPVKKPAQTEEQKVLAEAKEYFKIYVETHFKDPYSYKLQKIWVSPNTISSNARYAMMDYDYTIKHTDTTSILYRSAEAKNKLKTAIIKKQELEEHLKSLHEKDLEKVVDYTVYVDAYGANSYGNKILGKYYFRVDRNGDLIDSIRTLD